MHTLCCAASGERKRPPEKKPPQSVVPLRALAVLACASHVSWRLARSFLFHSPPSLPPAAPSSPNPRALQLASESPAAYCERRSAGALIARPIFQFAARGLRNFLSTPLVTRQSDMAAASPKTYVVEHLDTELEAWSALEYRAIARESHAAGARFLLSSVPPELALPANLEGTGLQVEHRSIEETHAAERDRVCLLDPQAKQELSPSDSALFDVFLFGGILGTTAN